MMARWFGVWVFVLVGVGASGCGPALCAGTSCDCPSNATCAFGTIGDGARLNCAAGATCTGGGGANSNATCLGTSCTFTVGASSMLVCQAGTCNFTCNGACTAVCGAGCTLTCGGGTNRSEGGCS